MHRDSTHLRLLATVAVAGALFGCAATPEPPAQPTRPEVTISGASPERLKTALTSEMAKRKFHLSKSSATEFSFEQPASKAAQTAAASAAGRDPIERITYTVSTEGNDLKVVADIVVVRKLAAMEKPFEIGQGPEAQSVQSLLDKIAGEIGTAKTTKRDN
jgi:hypothetical protein